MLAVLFLVICVILFVTQQSAGYSPKQIAKTGSMEHQALEHVFEWFGLFPGWLMFLNVDVPNRQVQMLEPYDQGVNTKFTRAHPVPPYPSMLAGNMAVGAGGASPDVLDTSIYTHETLAPAGLVKPEIWSENFNK